MKARNPDQGQWGWPWLSPSCGENILKSEKQNQSFLDSQSLGPSSIFHLIKAHAGKFFFLALFLKNRKLKKKIFDLKNRINAH